MCFSWVQQKMTKQTAPPKITYIFHYSFDFTSSYENRYYLRLITMKDAPEGDDSMTQWCTHCINSDSVSRLIESRLTNFCRFVDVSHLYAIVRTDCEKRLILTSMVSSAIVKRRNVCHIQVIVVFHVDQMFIDPTLWHEEFWISFIFYKNVS